jgi:hypothetical protein
MGIVRSVKKSVKVKKLKFLPYTLVTLRDICIQKNTVLWYNLKLMKENGDWTCPVAATESV